MEKTANVLKKIIAVLFVFVIWLSVGTSSVYALADTGAAADGATVQVGGDLNVHFINAGQGDATVIEFPDGRKMLIDASDTGKEEIVLDYLTTYIFDTSDDKADYFDIVMLTHADADHCGGIKEVLTEFPAKVFYRPNTLAVAKNDFTDPGESDLKKDGDKLDKKDSNAYRDAIGAAYKTFEIDGTEITPNVIVTNAADETTSIIKPDLPQTDPNYYEMIMYAPVSVYFKNVNDYSPIMVLTYQGKRFALSGDAEEVAEEEFVALVNVGGGKYDVFDENFTVDVIKLGHHGSKTSSSEDYLEIMTTETSRPAVKAIASCGKDNSYGHPHEEVLTRLVNMGFNEDNVLVTWEDGDVVFSVKGKVENGTVTYSLMQGEAEVIVPSGGNSDGDDSFNLGKREIIIIIVVIVVVVLFAIMFGSNNKKRKRKSRNGNGKKSSAKSSTKKRKK